MKAVYSSIAALALAFSLVLPAAAEPPGALEGRVVNATKGGILPAALEVTLRSSNPEAGPDQRTTADREGRFRFAGLTAAAPVSYTVSASYSGVEYKSPGVAFGPGEELKQVDLPVYETTEDGSGIQTDLAHIVIEMDPGAQTLVVSEFQVLSNGGDRTYLGPPSSGPETRTSARFPLPQDAVHLQPLANLGGGDLAALPQGPGFADTAPFLPGKREAAFSYMLDYMDQNYTFLKPLAYPTSRINVLVSDIGAQIGAPGLANQRTLDIEGKKFLLLSGEGLKQGQTLEVQLTGLPLAQGEAKGAADNLKLAAVGLPVVALGLALVFFLMRSRRPQMQPAPVAVAIDDEKVQLIQALAELDDTYEAGRIAEPEYQRLRAQKKHRLAELW